MIRPVHAGDRAAVAAVWTPYAASLGPFGLAWHRYTSGSAPNERWDLISYTHNNGDEEVYGFVHWRARRDGWRTVYEIAVRPDVRRGGAGTQLMRHVGRPVRLKTDEDNAAARAFYERLGLAPVEFVAAKSGKRMVVYEGLEQQDERESPREGEPARKPRQPPLGYVARLSRVLEGQRAQPERSER